MVDQNSLIFWTTFTGIVSALATGLGAIPVHFIDDKPKIIRGIASAVAAGMMISASVFSLAQEGISLKAKMPSAPYVVILGLMLGAFFFWCTARNLSNSAIYKNHLHGKFSRKSLLILWSPAVWC